MTDEFLSTPSARRATESGLRCAGGFPYFYPRPLRGGRPPYGIDYQSGRKISIHALCEEGDACSVWRQTGFINFYPRPLRGGRQSTLLLEHRRSYFYPRPLRGGRPGAESGHAGSTEISIHALCEEGDQPYWAAGVQGLVISIHALCEEGDQSFQFTMQTVK